MADLTESVTIRDRDSGEERSVTRGALPFFVNQGYEVLDGRGHANQKATAAAVSVHQEK